MKRKSIRESFIHFRAGLSEITYEYAKILHKTAGKYHGIISIQKLIKDDIH